MRFQLRNSAENRWDFLLLSNDGRELMSSPEFPNRDAAVNGIRAAIIAMREGGQYAHYTDRGNYFFRIANPAGLVVIKSEAFPSKEAAEQAAAAIEAEADTTEDFRVDFTTITTTGETRLKKELPKPPSKEEMLQYYFFTRSSTSGIAGPELYEIDNLYWFYFNDASGRAIVYSRGFEGASKRKTNIRSFLRYGSKEKYYERIEENGQYYFIVRTPNGFEIARSPMFANAAERDAAIVYIIANASNYKEDYAKATRKQKLDKQEYRFDYPSSSGKAGFESFKNPENKRNYFHLNDKGGNAILYSQAYRGLKPRDNGIRSVIKNGSKADRYRLKERRGLWYVVLLAANNAEIARSKPYSTQAEAEEMQSFLIRVMPGYATEYGVDLTETKKTKTTSETETFNIHLDIPVEAPAPEEKKTEQRLDDYLTCEAYKGGTDHEFHKFEQEGEYYFSYIGDNGEVYLRSEGYTTVAARDNGIQSVIKNAPIEARWTKGDVLNGKYYYYALKAANHQEIARSCYYNDEGAMLGAFGWITGDHSRIGYGSSIVAGSLLSAAMISQRQAEEKAAALAAAEKAAAEKARIAAAQAKLKAEREAARLAAEKEAKLKAEREAAERAKREEERLAAKKAAEEKAAAEKAALAAAAAAAAKVKAEEKAARLAAEKKAAEEKAAAAAKAKAEKEARLAAEKKAKEEKKAAAAAAAAATLAATAAIANTKKEKKVVKTAVTTKAAAATAAAASTSQKDDDGGAAGCLPWWAFLLLGLLLLAGLLYWKGCNGCGGAAIPATPTTEITTDADTSIGDVEDNTTEDIDTPTPAETTTPPVKEEPKPIPAPTCACTGSSSPIFNIPSNTTPKSLSRLGTNPEFGNSHSLDAVGFYNKLKDRAAVDAADKRFLDSIFKAMGYSGFADANAGMFSEVNVPRGTTGNMGYSRDHKTLYATLNATSNRDLKAFKIKAANGCDLHFMKTCGNHFFFCPR